MKHGLKPTVSQMKFLKDSGLQPANWLVVKNTPEFMQIVHRESRSVKKLTKVRR